MSNSRMVIAKLPVRNMSNRNVGNGTSSTTNTPSKPADNSVSLCLWSIPPFDLIPSMDQYSQLAWGGYSDAGSTISLIRNACDFPWRPAQP